MADRSSSPPRRDRHRLLPPRQPARCITGATGTGKTISLQLLAERFSRIGVRFSWPT